MDSKPRKAEVLSSGHEHSEQDIRTGSASSDSAPRAGTGVPLRLVCWHCGEGRDVVAHRHPQFGFELAGWAAEAGMVGYADMRYGRTLIFCNANHARAELTKRGTFRLRPAGSRASLQALKEEAHGQV